MAKINQPAGMFITIVPYLGSKNGKTKRQIWSVYRTFNICSNIA